MLGAATHSDQAILDARQGLASLQGSTGEHDEEVQYCLSQVQSQRCRGAGHW